MKKLYKRLRPRFPFQTKLTLRQPLVAKHCLGTDCLPLSIDETPYKHIGRIHDTTPTDLTNR
eukprot:Awhi_evm1s12436